MLIPEKQNIIWDWNGTLLDDVDLCVSTINSMLKKRNLKELTIESYREVFTFPVKDYYQKVGFNFEKEDWDIAAHEFIYAYLENVKNCDLTRYAINTLEFFSKKGLQQTIISAMHHHELVKSVRHLEIEKYFNHIGGIEDHLAGGKIENAKNHFKSKGIKAQNTLLIGDTLHDAEVAVELGCRCILVASGHQSHARLLTAGVPVVMTLEEITHLYNH